MLRLVSNSEFNVAKSTQSPQEWTRFWNTVNFTFVKHPMLPVTILGVVLFFLTLFLLHQRWTYLSTKRAKSTEIKISSERLASDLVKYFLPSAQVNHYRFRGMRQKSSPVSIQFRELALDIDTAQPLAARVASLFTPCKSSMSSNSRDQTPTFASRMSSTRVVNGVTGEFRAATINAVMGPSGCGKSSFLTVLCGKNRSGKASGQVLVNGQDVDLRGLKSILGFVPQDDIVFESLTVREQITFSAKLRNAPKTKSDHIQDIVDDVLAILQISHIQQSIVGGVEKRGISGGQRKRVNIGLELAACPWLLFLDEPTSGLDSTSSLQIINSLKKMTQLGVTIIMVIHQPQYALFTLFDDVLLLAKGGRTVYSGRSVDAVTWFESIGFTIPVRANPADWFMDVLSGVVVRDGAGGGTTDTGAKDGSGRASTAHATASTSLVEEWAGRPLDDEETCRFRKNDVYEISPEFDKACLVHNLQEEWDKVVKRGASKLRLNQFKLLLCGCFGHEIEDEITEELFLRISKVRYQTKHHIHTTDYICQEDFVDFLVSLQAVASRKPSKLMEKPATREMTLSRPDLGREIPGFLHQLKVIISRKVIYLWRQNEQRFIDSTLILGIATLMGYLHLGGMHFEDPSLAAKILTMHCALALLIAVSCLKVFGHERPMFWRECGGGLSVPAYTIGLMTISAADICLYVALYTCVYYLITQPSINFVAYAVPCFLVAACASGWGYLVSALLPPRNAPLGAVILILVVTVIFGNPGGLSAYIDGGINEAFIGLSITRWSVPMTFLKTGEGEMGIEHGIRGHMDIAKDIVARVLRQTGVKDGLSVQELSKPCSIASATMLEQVYVSGAMTRRVGYWNASVIALSTMAIVLRVLAYAGLKHMNRAERS